MRGGSGAGSGARSVNTTSLAPSMVRKFGAGGGVAMASVKSRTSGAGGATGFGGGGGAATFDDASISASMASMSC